MRTIRCSPSDCARRAIRRKASSRRVRRLSHTVHPAVLDDLGLEAALRKLARDSSHGNGIDIDVDARSASRRLPANVEAVLYRVAQEAVRNATRHASPRRIRISLFRSRPSVTLEVHDDGSGFDLAEAERRRRGMGLLSMRERVGADRRHARDQDRSRERNHRFRDRASRRAAPALYIRRIYD